MTNIKTTLAGVALIVGGLVRFYFAYKAGNFTEEAVMTCVTAVLSGVGLLAAKDNNVTGGSKVQ